MDEDDIEEEDEKQKRLQKYKEKVPLPMNHAHSTDGIFSIVGRNIIWDGKRMDRRYTGQQSTQGKENIGTFPCSVITVAHQFEDSFAREWKMVCFEFNIF